MNHAMMIALTSLLCLIGNAVYIYVNGPSPIAFIGFGVFAWCTIAGAVIWYREK